MERGTVYRYVRAANLDELLTKTTSPTTQLDSFKPYLHRRWNEGCTNAASLFAEIQAAGYSGSDQSVRRYVRSFRGAPAAPVNPPAQLKVRHVMTWIMPNPQKLKADERERLQQVLDRSPELNTLAGHV